MKIFQQRFKSQTLFIKLLFSFMIIIVLSLSFNYLSFTFFEKNVNIEILKYNNSNLNNTVENYENHFMMVKDEMLRLYFYENMQFFDFQISRKLHQQNDYNYYVPGKVSDDMSYLVSNPHLYLENIIIYSAHFPFIIDKAGIKTYNNLIRRYFNEDFNENFWKAEYEQRHMFKIHPSNDFHEISLDEKRTKKGSYFPITVNINSSPLLSMLGLINTDELFKNKHLSVNNKFIIFDQQENVIFSTENVPIPNMSMIQSHQGYHEQDDFYFFYKKGAFTNFTYINIIPVENINSQIIKIKFILAFIIALSLLISIIMSVFFSLRINTPIKKIIQSFSSLISIPPLHSNIKEFDIINENVSRIIKINKDIHKDLNQKNTLLTNFAYINKIKLKYTPLHEIQDLILDKHFILILFKVHYTGMLKKKISVEEDKATIYIQEFIKSSLSSVHDNLLTFQVDENEIVSILFGDDLTVNEVKNYLSKIKNAIDMDKEFCFLTITLSEPYPSSKDLPHVYQKLLTVVEGRPLNNDTEIIIGNSHNKTTLASSPEKEQEFFAQLKEGNDNFVVPWIHKTLSNMYKNGMGASEFHSYTENLTTNISHLLDANQIDCKNLGNHTTPQEQHRYLHTLDDFKNFFTVYLSAVCSLIKQKNGKQKDTIDLMITYLDLHYHENISLEQAAGHFHLSTSYFSTFFKNKMGINFVDYLQKLRVTKAKELLIETNLKVIDISNQIGYINTRTFNRIFKKWVGVTPIEYRQCN